MSNLFSVLNTSRTGLFAQQAGLSVTGNNIANVNTEGYTRQRAVLDALGSGGVNTLGVQRLGDSFTSARLLQSNSSLAASSTLSLNLGQIESILGGADSGGLTATLQDFFNAFQDLSQQPGGTPEREAVRSSTAQLSSAFASVTGNLSQLRSQIDSQVQSVVDNINTIAQQIADLNGKLSSAGDTSGPTNQTGVNELLDQRDSLLSQLSQLVPVRTVQAQNQAMTVFIGDRVLIEGSDARKLSTRADLSNDGMHEVYLSDVGSNGLALSGVLKTGKLAALLQSRDQEAGGALNEINRLAASLMRDFNVQNRAGTGLDGVSGRDFFTSLSVTANGAPANKGGAAVTASPVLDDTQLTFNDYEIRFTGPGQYDVVNTSTGATLSAGNAYVSGAAIDFDGMRVVISNDAGAPAARDVFRINSYQGAGANIDLSAAIQSDARAIAAGASSAPGDNTNALALAALRDAGSMGIPPSQTYESYLDNVRVRQSMRTASAQQDTSNEGITNNQLQSLLDSSTGVSLDEEATNLIQYQRAYQASSRVISMTDELLQTLINMI